MNEVTLRRRIVALVIAALLSVAGASVTAATVTDDAPAAQGTLGLLGPVVSN